VTANIGSSARQRDSDIGQTRTTKARHDERNPKMMTYAKTVHTATYDLLRDIELTAVFGNPRAGETNVTEELG
jgi:hypothetical protein